MLIVPDSYVGYQLFSLRTLKILFYCLLASVVADEKPCIHHIGSFVDNLFSVLWSLLILSLCLWCFITIRVDMDFIIFILYRASFYFSFWSLIYFLKPGYYFFPSIWNIFYYSFSLFTHYGNPDKHWTVHSSLHAPSIFSSPFSPSPSPSLSPSSFFFCR